MMQKLETWNSIMIVCFFFIFVVGTTGNVLVIWVFNFVKADHRDHRVSNKNRITPMDRCITYLAVIDLLSSVLNPLVYISYEASGHRDWYFGEILCKVIPSLQTVFDTMSFGMILVITVERCIVLCFPFRINLHLKEMHRALIVVMVVSVLNELTYIINLQLTITAIGKYTCSSLPASNITCGHKDGLGICHGNGTKIHDLEGNSCDLMPLNVTLINSNETSMWFCCGDELSWKIDESIQIQCNKSLCRDLRTCLPIAGSGYTFSRMSTLLLRDILFILVFSVSSLLIYKRLTRNERRMQGQTPVRAKRCLKILLTMAGVFCILVFPKDLFHIIYIICQLIGKTLNHGTSVKVNSVLKLFQCCNSIVNGFIYARLHCKFKRRVKELSKNITHFQWTPPVWLRESRLARMRETRV